MAGVAVAVALPMKYVNRPGNPPAVNDTITVETDKPSLSSINETANVSAISSAGRDVTLSCDIPGISSTSDYFNPKTGVVTYFDEAVEGRTITIIANDGMATKQTLKIDFNSIPRPDKSIYMTVDTN
ncbi:hypothetical protein FACS1894166_04680 [Bacilli bacterium]|nr:hypothetical protein FACS1894166_04680 [Bacilli bacterium]